MYEVIEVMKYKSDIQKLAHGKAKAVSAKMNGDLRHIKSILIQIHGILGALSRRSASDCERTAFAIAKIDDILNNGR